MKAAVREALAEHGAAMVDVVWSGASKWYNARCDRVMAVILASRGSEDPAIVMDAQSATWPQLGMKFRELLQEEVLRVRLASSVRPSSGAGGASGATGGSGSGVQDLVKRDAGPKVKGKGTSGGIVEKRSVEDRPQLDEMCWYDGSCTKPKCRYKHSQKRRK